MSVYILFLVSNALPVNFSGKMFFRHRRRPKRVSDAADAQNALPTPPTPKTFFQPRRRPKCFSDTADAQNVFPTPPTPNWGGLRKKRSQS